MTTLVLISYCLLLPLLWLSTWHWIGQKVHFLKKSSVLLSFIYGASLALFIHALWHTKILSALWPSESEFARQILQNVILTPFFEEWGKALILIYIWSRREIKSIPEGILQGCAVGFGFAFCENLISSYYTGLSVSDLSVSYHIWYRTTHTTILHGSTTALFGLALGLTFEKHTLSKRYIWPISLALGISAHILWNLLGIMGNTRGLEMSLFKILMNLELAMLFFIVSFIYLQVTHKKSQKPFVTLLGKGVVSTLAIVLISTGFYHYFILKQAQSSDEYQTAIHFITHSNPVNEIIKIEENNLKLLDVTLTQKNNLPLTTLVFEIHNTPLHSFCEISLIKRSQFLLVYEAYVIEKNEEKIILPSTYENLQKYFSALNLKSNTESESLLNTLNSEIASATLKDILQIKFYILSNAYNQSLPLLNALILKNYSDEIQSALIFDKALALYENSQLSEASLELQKIIQRPQSILPTTNELNDFWSIQFNDKYVLVKSHILLSKIYYDLEQFELGLHWAKEGATQASLLNDPLLLNNALYLKALHLQALGDLKLASLVFDEVILDPQNFNLGQKSWAHFFKSETAIRENRTEDAVIELEEALRLDPKNPVIRQKAIEYLIYRNYPGDLELALALALRGIQIKNNNEVFLSLASQIYQRLELPDKTQKSE